MHYEGTVYRPPSEAGSYILQATIGCSWDACTYCAMYREKTFRVRPLPEILDEIEEARAEFGNAVRKVFVADGDPLVMDIDHWRPILEACRTAFPRLRRVSTYATAMNFLAKAPDELAASNYLPVEGRLPRDRDRILEMLDRALAGRIPLRPERARGL